MTGEIRFSGLASGIDTDSLIEKLMILERRPQSMLKDKAADYVAKRTVVSTLNSKLSSLSTIMDKFSDASSPFFAQKTATTTQSNVVQATITGALPAQGNYQINVTQVATAAMAQSQAALYTGTDATARGAQTLSSAVVNAPSMTVDPTQSLASQAANLNTPAQASGSFSINGTSVAWDNTMSINTIVGNINNAGLGVTAKFDAAAQTFSLTSNSTGSTSQFTLAESSGNFLSAMNLSAGTFSGNDAVKTDPYVALNAAGAHLDRAVTNGTFSINGVTFSVNAATDTLSSIMNRISSSSAGVLANYDSASGRVMLTQKSEGSSQKIVLGAAGDSSNILYALKLSATNPPVGGVGDTVSGTDAKITVNGAAEQTFSSNTVDTVVPGVTLNLKGTGTSLVTISPDVDSMVDTVKEFVTQYNDVMNYINTKTREERAESPTTAEERIQGQFTGDATFLDAKYKLTQVVNQVVSGQPSTLNQLAQIGVTSSAANFGKDATLEVNESKLRAALTSNPTGVDAMFNTPGTGLMSKMKDQIYALNNFVNGAVTSEKKYYDNEINSMATQINDMEARMVKREETMRLQFASMESMISTLKSQGDRITQLMAKS